MYTHNLDPILIDLGLVVIRWYFSHILDYFGIGGLKENNTSYLKIPFKFHIDEFDDLITYIILSIIFGVD